MSRTHCPGAVIELTTVPKNYRRDTIEKDTVEIVSTVYVGHDHVDRLSTVRNLQLDMVSYVTKRLRRPYSRWAEDCYESVHHVSSEITVVFTFYPDTPSARRLRNTGDKS